MNKNLVILCGHLVDDCKKFSSSTGSVIVRGVIAINRTIGSGDSQQKVVDFIPIVAFGAIGEKVLLPYGCKGKQLLIQGHLSVVNKKSTDADGNVNYTTYANVVVESVQLGYSPKKDGIPANPENELAELEISEDELIF